MQPHQRSQNRYPRHVNQPQGSFPPRKDRNTPSLDPSQLASALKVKNFGTLLATAGDEETLALALDMPLQRVAELKRGENFTGETAHHIETTLGLTNKFLDQVNPTLTDDVVNRLKSPLNYRRDDEPDTEAATSPATTNNVVPFSGQTVIRQTPEAASAVPAQQQEVDMAKQPASSAPAKKTRGPKAAPKPLSEALFPSEPILDVRRRNLAVLTDGPGAKIRVGSLLNLSSANISHRIHGKRKFDEGQAQIFTSTLGLPADWFEEPREAEDIPAKVVQLLNSGEKAPRGAKAAAKRATTAAKKTVAPADVQVPKLSQGVVTPNRARATAPAAAPAPVAALASASSAPAAAPAASRAASAPSLAPASTLASALPDELLVGLSYISLALLQTLAFKAREGRLTDDAALKMLGEAHAL